MSGTMSWCARELHIHIGHWQIPARRLIWGYRCDIGCILGRIVDQRIQVRGFCLTWTWSLPVTVLGVGKFSLAITGRLLCTPINVLGIIVLGARKSPSMTWPRLCRPINVLEIRRIFYLPVELLIKLPVIIGFLVICWRVCVLAAIRAAIRGRIGWISVFNHSTGRLPLTAFISIVWTDNLYWLHGPIGMR